MGRRRRDAIPNRQYDIFQSTGYSTVNMGELWWLANVYACTKFLCMYILVCMYVGGWGLHIRFTKVNHSRRLHMLKCTM